MKFLKDDDFSQIDALAELLERENAGIESGNTAIVADLLAEKAVLAARIEAMEAAIADGLAGQGPEAEALRARVSRLKTLLGRNGRLVSRMAGAVRDVAFELARLAERESLAGTYDARGERLAKDGKKMAELSKNSAINKTL
ncbi:hypothetical protein P6F26_09305 [Roseibacterium sp. SDUM158017]|uniref:hypothetical protein n=1 Tax=Roseicyclus salinarum TaxID=3036773 RepID=UPI002414F9F7|nr:hypothetical protein [Roseibacterium sp. SDUM158017]MDG4648643.1 hypothetical protein [Roseibacterium sp. SDUM158017]